MLKRHENATINQEPPKEIVMDKSGKKVTKEDIERFIKEDLDGVVSDAGRKEIDRLMAFLEEIDPEEIILRAVGILEHPEIECDRFTYIKTIADLLMIFSKDICARWPEINEKSRKANREREKGNSRLIVGIPPKPKSDDEIAKEEIHLFLSRMGVK